jgi:hypothetical protein
MHPSIKQSITCTSFEAKVKLVLRQRLATACTRQRHDFKNDFKTRQDEKTHSFHSFETRQTQTAKTRRQDRRPCCRSGNGDNHDLGRRDHLRQETTSSDFRKEKEKTRLMTSDFRKEKEKTRLMTSDF